MGDTSKLASKIQPPSELPSFLTQKTSEQVEKESSDDKKSEIVKDESQEQEQKNEEVETPELPALPMQEIANALTPITEGVKNSVLYSWMKDSIKSSVEIAKDSVQSFVVTLDPQMSGILYSGGDYEIIIASMNDDKIDSAREAFQHVFKKATVYGQGSKSVSSVAAQPAGFESAEVSAKERINALRSNENLVDKTILSIENFLVELYKNQWFDAGLLYLSDPRNNITLKTFTQFTPIPQDIMKMIQDETPADYDKRDTGFGVTIGSVMSKYLNTPHYEWHEKYTGIARYDLIVNAAKSLASIYKCELQSKKVPQEVEK